MSNPQPASSTPSLTDWWRYQWSRRSSRFRSPRQWWATRKDRPAKTDARRVVAVIVLILMWTYGTYNGLIALPSLDTFGGWVLVVVLILIAVTPFVLVTRKNPWIAVLGLIVGVAASGFLATQWGNAGQFLTTVTSISAIGLFVAVVVTIIVLRLVCRVPREAVANTTTAAPAAPAAPAAGSTTSTP